MKAVDRQPSEGTTRVGRFVVLCVVECCVLQGLPVKLMVTLATQKNPDASLDL